MNGITILGSRGLVGSGLVKAFNKRGKSFWSPGRVDEAELFKRPLGTVYYCIGLTADYRDRPFDTIEAHVSLLARILKEANFERLVYLSSTRLYDSLGRGVATEGSELRISPASPRHLYDISKALGENLCLTASNGRASVARLACVVGSGWDDDGFVPDLLRQTVGRQRLEVESSPHFVRDYIGLDDVVGLLIRIAEEGAHSIYNVASGNNIANHQLFELIEKLTGCVVSCRSQNRHDHPLVDTHRIQQEFGFAPTPLSELLKKLISSEKML